MQHDPTSSGKYLLPLLHHRVFAIALTYFPHPGCCALMSFAVACADPGEALSVADGWCSGDAIATAERYDPCRRMWALVASKCKERCGVGVGVINDLPYTVRRQ